MAIATNLTPYAVGEWVGLDGRGVEVYCVVIKATFVWTADGNTRLAGSPLPIEDMDVYAEEPGASGLLAAGDLGFPKPFVDVILVGEVEVSGAVEQIDAAISIGTRMSKTVRIFGDRRWLPGVAWALVPSRPRPFTRMPLVWERSFGGTDPDDPRCRESRNPVGSGLRSKAKALVGRSLPNFEDPRVPIRKPSDRPEPVGFGPIAPSWQPRVGFAGTYDQQWLEERFPLLPADFRQEFFNVAPVDQRLSDYRAGEQVRLLNLTPAHRDRFLLPSFDVPVTLVDDEGTRVESAILCWVSFDTLPTGLRIVRIREIVARYR